MISVAKSSNTLSQEAIESQLNQPCTLKVYDCVTSTNTLAKESTIKTLPLAIVANQQTMGRGRLGRRFASPSGCGIYMSLLIEPTFSLTAVSLLTMAQAVATCRAIEKVCQIQPSIKWVNDLYWKQKKICGILTEAQTNVKSGRIDRLVIGSGVNCFPGDMPQELSSIAGCISNREESFSRNDLAAAMINETLSILATLEDRSFLDEYRSRCMILGQAIRIHPTCDETEIPAIARSITDDGGLLVEYADGQTEVLHTGEISIRLALD